MAIFKKKEQRTINRFVGLIVGESGAGKTTQCIHLDPAKTALIIVEDGTLCFKKHGYMPNNVAEIKTTDDLMEAYEELSRGIDGIEYVFIDSLTEIGEKVLEELKADEKYKDPKMTLKMYMVYGETMTKIIKAFRDLNRYSVIFTCLTEKEKDGLETYDDFNMPGSSVKNSLKAYFDLVLHLKTFKDDQDVEHRVFLTSATESRLAKDRSGVLESYEEANINNIINKVLGA